jgi:hypothetical protein
MLSHFKYCFTVGPGPGIEGCAFPEPQQDRLYIIESGSVMVKSSQDEKALVTAGEDYI